MKRLALVSVCVVVGAAACAAPPPPPEPPSMAITESIRAPYEMVKGYITQTAEMIPEDRLGYQPTQEVRTFGQLIGHIADSNYMLCSVASGEAAPEASIEQTVTAKADLEAALAESFAFCDRAIAELNDQTGAEEATIVPINNMQTTRLGALAFNAAHGMEHYGNLVTYMRLNKMVPPSSQPAPGM